MSAGKKPKPEFVIALAGNANVGKSAIFNQLTGLNQIIGNWPGKTVERAEGTLYHHGKIIKVIDLPGIYSFSTYSDEEIISREYIAFARPDVVVNVIDSTSLERNLFFTFQLLEMNVPVVIALNLADIARKKGINIDPNKLQKLLRTPVVSTVAIKGLGIHDIVDKAILAAAQKPREDDIKVRYGTEVEKRIEKLCAALGNIDIGYPRRWAAIKLLEGDTKILMAVRSKMPELVNAAKILADEIAHIHKEPCTVVISSERYALAARITKRVQRISKPSRTSVGEQLDALSMHWFWGYVILFVILLSIIAFITIFGGWVTEILERSFESINPGTSGFWPEIAWNGAVIGFCAALSVAFGFVMPFYLILGTLEDSGYLPKIAYLMDTPCHAVGLHGKACMPLLLAFGCNVPACAGCRIMETKRERLIAIVLATLVPCSARTAVILGLVGVYMGLQWAIALYVLDFILIFLVGKALNIFVPGKSVGIIMEMPEYRLPSASVVAKQAWHRFRPFLLVAVPLIVVGSTIIEAMRVSNVLETVSGVLRPITVFWLGLPAFTGILLIFGILRKEAALVLLVTIAGTMELGAVMSTVQMFVFALVTMLYIPCIATIAMLVREVGWKNTAIIVFAEIGLALLIGGIVFRVLSFLMQI